jgi:hypothetical protein
MTRERPATTSPPRVGVDQRVDVHHLLFERRGRRDNLERRARLVEVLDRAVPPLVLLRVAERVRVEGRLVRHRQDLAGPRIHDDGGTALRVIDQDAGAELPLSDVLEVLVERQLDARSRSRRTLEAAEDMAPRVGVNQNRPGFAADFGVVGVLEPVQPVLSRPT